MSGFSLDFRRHSRLCQEKAGKKVPIENKKAAESMKAQNRSLSILSFSRISCALLYSLTIRLIYDRSKPQWHYFVVKPGDFNIFLMFTKSFIAIISRE